MGKHSLPAWRNALRQSGMGNGKAHPCGTQKHPIYRRNVYLRGIYNGNSGYNLPDNSGPADRGAT